MKKMSRELNSLFWTQLYGALNDNLFKSALVILITYKNISLFGVPSASMVALCGGIFIFPFFFFSATSGQLADKYDKVWLSYRIKEAEVGIAFLGALGLLTNNYYLMLFVLFLFGLQSTFFGPIKYSLIPIYAKKETLVFANALISSGTFIAILLGTIGGGVVAVFKQNPWPLIAILVGIALLGLYHVKKLPLENNNEKSVVTIDWNFFTATKKIVLLVFYNSKIRLLTIGLSWFWFLGAGFLSLLPLLAKDLFHANESVATLLLFTFTVGMGVGPFFLEKTTKGKINNSFIPLSLVVMTLIIFDLAFVVGEIANKREFFNLENQIGIASFFKLENSIRVIFDLFFLSFFGGIFTVPQFANLQMLTPEKELSRVVAGNNIINSLAMVGVSLCLMVFHKLSFSLSFIFFIFALLNTVMCLILIFFYYRSSFQRNKSA